MSCWANLNHVPISIYLLEIWGPHSGFSRQMLHCRNILSISTTLYFYNNNCREIKWETRQKLIFNPRIALETFIFSNCGEVFFKLHASFCWFIFWIKVLDNNQFQYNYLNNAYIHFLNLKSIVASFTLTSLKCACFRC